MENVKVETTNKQTILEKRLDTAIKESEERLANNPQWTTKEEFFERLEKI